MNKDEYKRQQQTILLFTRMMVAQKALIDFQDMIDAMNKADAVGPILDPTLWMRGADNMNDIRTITVAFRDFVTKAEAPLHRLEVSAGVESLEGT